MSGAKFPRILFFIEGTAPTVVEQREALKIGAVSFRNASMVEPTDKAEKCDGVAGDPDIIPAVYEEAGVPVINSLEEAVKIMQEMQEKENAAAYEALGPIVGKKGKMAKKEGAPAQVAGKGWSPNA